ncbi:uncharacterized protein [Miscanthus floridulus]|uniref:uncharacterized protein n=1 Tax=Miscanthus floridulus TaxID=154761 RepID=UPI00345AC054
MDSLNDDDESEAGRGPLDHLPDVRETALEARRAARRLQEEGEGASRLAIARPGAEADMPETRVSGKCAVSPMGSTAEVERATAGAAQLPSQRAEGASESDEGRPVPADTAAVPLPPATPASHRRDEGRCGSYWFPVRAESKDLLADANELLSARSAEVEDLRLHCADIKAEAATAREQVAPLAARIQELEEELTRAVGERDTFRSRAEQEAASAKAIAEQLEAEQGMHLLMKGALAGAVKVAKASQAVLKVEIREHDALQSIARTACEALGVEGVELGSSLGSHLITLSDRVHERLQGVLHTGVKRALAVVSSHYAGINLEAISDGYVMTEDDEKAEEEVMKLVKAAEAPGMALARLFKEEVVPPMPTTDAGDPEF